MRHQPYNSLTINAFTRGGTTPIGNAGFDYRETSGLGFETYWPGGLYGGASFYVPRDLATSWASSGAYRIVAYNGLTPVYEGYVGGITRTVDANTSGITIRCVGGWGAILDAQTINKPWSDDRADSSNIYRIDTVGDELWQDHRDQRELRVVPNPGGVFANNSYVAFQVKAPTGQTWKRLKYSYSLKENAGEAWEMLVWNNATSAAEGGTSVTATGTGTFAANLGTPSQTLEFRYYSRAAQTTTTTADSNHAIWSNIVLQTETDTTITATVVINDVLATCTDLNPSTAYLSAPTVDIAPFITDGQLSYADIIMRALSVGGASGANYYAQLLESDWLKQGATGKPILRVGAYPAVTSSYEYELSLHDRNLVAPFTLDENYDDIYNWVAVEYTDKTGNNLVVTPDDDATLTDATSVSKYGKRSIVISAGQINPGIYLSDIRMAVRMGNRVNASQAAAISYGVRYLVRYKSPSWRLSAPISVLGYIRKRGDIRKPCSEIRAGERVLFSNFPASPVSAPLMGSSPLISIISQTAYVDADGGVNALSFGDLSGLW